MADLTPAAQRWLATHHGVITTATLQSLDVGKQTRRRLVAAGVLRAVDRGIFVISTASSTFEQRCAVMCATHPSGFVTGPSGGMLLGLRRMPRTTTIHFAVRHGLHLTTIAGVRHRQTTAIGPADRAVRADGIVVAAPVRLAFDLAADLRPLDHLSVLEQLLQLGTVTHAELSAIDRRLGHPARPGSGQFRRTLLRLGTAAADSHPEVLLADALERRGVPIERQSRVLAFANGRSARIDLAVPAVRWGVELDIHPEHRSVEGHAQDAGRVRHLHRVGWQIEQVAERDMLDVEGLADELATLYRERAIAVGSDPSAGGPFSRPPALGRP
ncbi:MAG: hypothetical protein ABW328_14890 [Ilumatobacteraceae bacterium]